LRTKKSLSLFGFESSRTIESIPRDISELHLANGAYGLISPKVHLAKGTLLFIASFNFLLWDALMSWVIDGSFFPPILSRQDERS